MRSGQFRLSGFCIGRKNMKQKIIALSLLTAILMTGCRKAASSAADTTAPQTTAAVTSSADTTASSDSSSLAVATGDDVIASNEVGYEGMVPVPAASVKPGEYQITVDSSSSMFKIADCKLIVADGKMQAKLSINSKSYDYLFAGTAEQAAKADASEYITPEETDSGYKFTFPVEALDQEIECAALSHKKQLWYDRKLVFRADSLPEGTLPEQKTVTAETLGLSDGTYQVNVTLEGGSGRASVQSPAKLTVSGGKAAAEIIWSSNKYDYMIADGEKYLPTDTTEFSVFEIPVSAFDRKLKVKADTTAMSTPHEIEYTLYFDSASIKQ